MNKYKSELEKDISKQIREKGYKVKYETVKLDYTINGTYKPDFILDNGIMIECKGYHRGLSEALRRLRAVKESNPNIDLRMLLSNSKVKIGTKMTLGKWCDKYGFEWAEKIIPDGWYK